MFDFDKDPNSEESNRCVTHVENGLRMVRPYMFTHSCYCKGRWAGKPVLCVFVHEFRPLSSEYFSQAINDGRLLVNWGKVDAKYLLRQGDTIQHFLHRHEPPVLDERPIVIGETDNMIAFYKPASMPVHPCGRYRHNSFNYIVAREYPDKMPIYSIHRLDRLTSGVLLFAKASFIADSCRRIIQDKATVKVYLALVAGEFPNSNGVKVCVPINDYRVNRTNVDTQDTVRDIAVCELSMQFPHPVIAEPPYKNAETWFFPIMHLENENVTMVLCRPITGRTHQIRAHLKYLGHPVVNDVAYGGKADAVAGTMRYDLDKPDRIWFGGTDFPVKEFCKDCQNTLSPEIVDAHKWRIEELSGEEIPYFKYMFICLHAAIYYIDGTVFEAPLPEWATVRGLSSERLRTDVKNLLIGKRALKRSASNLDPCNNDDS